jgi:DNA-directed RNA polymerase subunit RPC12/RpoP
MADQVTEYKCPACGGPLHFDAKLGKLKCDYCGSVYTPEEIEAIYKKKDEAAAAQGSQTQWANDTNQWTEEEAKHLRAYSCPSCGAQLICDENTVASSCPYCGNPTVVPAQFSGALKPDYVIPFMLDKDQAVAALQQYYRGKKLLPSAFAAKNHIEEIKGVYVPFWLYDGTADVHYQAHATRVSSYVQGNDQVTVTEHYRVVRDGDIVFEKVPVDGSSKMPDELMDAIEPFNYEAMVPFSSAYLPGYLADKYDQDSAASQKRAYDRMNNSAISTIAASVAGYSSVAPEAENVDIQNGKSHYAFLPVWMLSTKYNGKNYLFAMNGETGKMIGDLPIDPGKTALWFCGVAGGLMAVLAAALLVKWG